MAILYPMRLGVSAAAPTTPTFAGIVDLIIYTNGVVKPRWAAATNKTSYKIYVRAGSSSIFSDTYWVQSAPDTALGALVANIPDLTRLVQDTTYYIGVRAVNETVTDSNTATIAFEASANGLLLKLPVVAINA